MRPITPLAIALALAISAPVFAQEQRPQIAVSGAGEVEVTPDIAIIRAGMRSEAEVAADALAANAEQMRAIFGELEVQGVARADIQTSRLTLDAIRETVDPDEGGRTPRVTGYAATNLLTVRVRDVAATGAVIDGLGRAGVNRIEGVAFDIADPRPHLDAARRLAVEDAVARAALLSDAAGATLGRILTIDEMGGPVRPQPMFARAEAAMDMPVAEGALTIGAEVRIVYALE